MKEANNIEELFKSKLHDLETPVRADLWNNVAAQSGIQTTFWSASKIAAASVAVLVVTGAVLFWQLNTEKVAPNADNELVQQVLPETQEDVIQTLPETQDETAPEDETFEQPATVEQKRTVRPESLLEKQEKTDRVVQLPEPTPVVQKPEPAQPLQERVAQPKPKEEMLVANPMPIEKAEETTKKSNVETFEPAERLDLEVLIAPEKREEASRESKHYPSAFPRIFNPNLPGDAGTFSIEVRDVSYFKIEVRNQKGHLMFSSRDANFVWKGTTLDGSLAPEGTYLFLIESNDNDGEALKPQSGAVFLMRK